MGPIGCPETSVRDYHSTLRNIPEQRGSVYQGINLKKVREVGCPAEIRTRYIPNIKGRKKAKGTKRNKREGMDKLGSLRLEDGKVKT